MSCEDLEVEERDVRFEFEHEHGSSYDRWLASQSGER